MDFAKVLRQAWQNVISYRALWIFGILIALATVSGSGFFVSRDYSPDRPAGWQFDFQRQEGEPFLQSFAEAWQEAGKEFRAEIRRTNAEIDSFYKNVLGVDWEADIVKFVTVMLWLLLIFYVIGRIAYYVSETALIHLVDKQEGDSQQENWREGFRQGWSPKAWRLFLIDLVIGIPAAMIFMILFSIILAPVFVLGSRIIGAGWMGIIFASGLLIVLIIMSILIAEVVRLVKQFMRRVCVLEDAAVFASVGRGYRLFRGNIKESGLMWLVLLGVNIAWPLISGLFAVLISAVGGLISGLIGLLAGLTASLLNASSPVVVGVIFGLPLFLALLIIPLVALEGLKEVFRSSAWTLTYREFLALEALAAKPKRARRAPARK